MPPIKTFAKWLVLGSAIGVLSGLASSFFLMALQWATDFRISNPRIIFALPIAGFVLGWVYLKFAGTASQGNNLVIEEIHSNQNIVPARMAPLILFATVLTHLFGGSAGREGTALQMGASLADSLRRILNLNKHDRRLMLMAGISGGFGSVFGTPIAGFVFGMEVQSIGRIRYEGLLPCLIAAIVGDLTTRLIGIGHAHYPALPQIALQPVLLLKVVLMGLIAGLVALLFIELTEFIKRISRQRIAYAPLRPVIGGAVLVALTLALGTQDYLGLSLPLIQHSMSGDGVPTFAFVLKLVFTAITLGTGFLGGEVTPLFVIGSTLGFTLGKLLGVEPAFAAMLGFVAVFAGASNTPLACALMGIELFGGGSALYLVVVCAVAYLASGHRSIYAAQRIAHPKHSHADIEAEENELWE